MSLREAFRFFHAHSGGPVGWHAQTALALAKAERYAEIAGFKVSWEDEDLPYEDCLGDHALWCSDEKSGLHHSHEIYCAVLRDQTGEIREVLGAIIDPDPTYRRIVAAELALQAMPGSVP